jgi:hypothetical protein
VLIYTSFAIMGQEAKPLWIEAVKRHPLAMAAKWEFYDPWEPISVQLAKDGFASELSKPAIELAHDPTLKMDPRITSVLDEPVKLALKQADIETAEGGDAMLTEFKDLYALTRSQIMLVDLSVPSFGGRSQEVLYAYLLEIPIIGISSRFMNSPWLINKCEVVLQPNADRIMKQIVALTGLGLSVKMSEPQPEKDKAKEND